MAQNDNENDDIQVVGDWDFPAHIDVPAERFYPIDYGDNRVNVLDWYGHVYMAHQLDLVEIQSQVVDAGNDGTRYAAVRVEVVLGDGQKFSAIGGADGTSRQVRDPEHVWSVAESRALKRAIKKALPMIPHQGDVRPGEEETGDVIPRDDSVEAPDVDVERKPPPPPASPPEDEELPERATPAADDDDELPW